MTLDDITMARFIDLVSGRKRGNEEVVSRLISEYRQIADPQGFKRHLLTGERLLKARMANTLYRMCSNLLSTGRPDKVKELLKLTGTNLAEATDERLRAEILSRLDKTAREIEKYKEEDSSQEREEDVRKNFDTLTAVMMAHFKFQIDLTTIKASIYANMVNLFERELKAAQKVKKNKKGY
ncbi:MAG: hypothetical protein K2G69_03945 [Muribaculaceae bacterium]|nr:hypothetical protein [Muribaculaceae bacterium]